MQGNPMVRVRRQVHWRNRGETPSTGNCPVSAGLATQGAAAKPREEELSAMGVFVLAGICSPLMSSHSSRTKSVWDCAVEMPKPSTPINIRSTFFIRFMAAFWFGPKSLFL